MKKKSILSMAVFAISIMVTTSGIFAVGNFTGKGRVVAATITATSTATGTATDTQYYPNYIPVTYGTVEESLDCDAILNKSQTVVIDYQHVDPVSVVFPQAFVNADKLEGKFWIDIAYDNFEYSKYSYSRSDVSILNNNGYKVLDKAYDFLLIASSFNGDQTTIDKFDKPISVTISLSDSQLNGFDKTKLKVLYVDENGKIEVMPTTVNGNNVTFTTTHFSTYYIGQVKDTASTAATTSASTKATTSAKTSDSNNVVRIVSFALGSIVLATTVTILGIKKKNIDTN